MATLLARRHRYLVHRPDPRDLTFASACVDMGSAGLPVGPPPQVVLAAQRAAEELHRARLTGADELRGRLARSLRVDRDRLVLGAGVGQLLRDLLDVVCDLEVVGGPRSNEIVYATPAADSYLRAVESVHATPVPVPLIRGRQDLDALAAAIDRDRCRAVMVSNPHFPTGGLVLGGELEDFLDRVPAHVLVVLDETNRDYALHPPAAIDIPDGLHLEAGHPEREGNRPNVAVLRSWDTYGLAALPIGYLAADPLIASAVTKTAVSPTPSRVAQAAAAATLDDAVHDQYRAIWEAVARSRSRLGSELRHLGFDVPDSCANYLWIRLGELADDFARHCAQHRVHVRVYPRQGVLVTVGLPEHNDAFLTAAMTYRHPDPRPWNAHRSENAPRPASGPDGVQDGADSDRRVNVSSGAGVGDRTIGPLTGSSSGTGA